jgi:hypothetical protein
LSFVPANPCIYHITHVDNLRAIAEDGSLVSDAVMVAKGGPAAPIGMSKIKSRRLAFPVACHAGTHVGDYVPFYFCPRSVMLYMLHRGNHEDITYRGGQEPIVHLEADLLAVVAWADAQKQRWAFSLSNAGANYTQFRANVANLNELNWPAIGADAWSQTPVKEGKQAEFLVHGTFPWSLVSRIGVYSLSVAQQVTSALANVPHKPAILEQKQWYY